jgi:hypothetical protein
MALSPINQGQVEALLSGTSISENSPNLHGLFRRYLKERSEMRVGSQSRWLVSAVLVALVCREAAASLGDRLPDFRECVKVGARGQQKSRLTLVAL